MELRNKEKRICVIFIVLPLECGLVGFPQGQREGQSGQCQEATFLSLKNHKIKAKQSTGHCWKCWTGEKAEIIQ